MIIKIEFDNNDAWAGKFIAAFLAQSFPGSLKREKQNDPHMIVFQAILPNSGNIRQ